MLGNLLEKLSSFFSRSFLVNCIPLLFFAFLHTLTAYFANASFQGWVRLRVMPELGQASLVTFAALLALTIVAYVLSTLNLLMRQILEGRYLPDWIAAGLGQRHQDRLHKVERKLTQARRELGSLRTKGATWNEQLGEAMREGFATKRCSYIPPEAVKTVIRRRENNDTLAETHLQAAVNALVPILKANSTQEVGNAQSDKLDADNAEVRLAILYAIEQKESEVVRYFNVRQFDFAGAEIRPTRMGIIAETAAYYAKSRYGLNLDFFWSRLQKAIAADSTLYSNLQDAKSQLDFMVSMFWHTTLYTLIWVLVLPSAHPPLWEYAVVAGLGPLTAGGASCATRGPANQSRAGPSSARCTRQLSIGGRPLPAQREPAECRSERSQRLPALAGAESRSHRTLSGRERALELGISRCRLAIAPLCYWRRVPQCSRRGRGLCKVGKHLHGLAGCDTRAGQDLFQPPRL